MSNSIKYILLWVVALLPLWGVAQTTVTANRVIVKDSLSLDGKWIKRINTSNMLQNAGEQTISTDAELKRYIDQAVAEGGTSAIEVAKMIKNPYVLNVGVTLWSKGYINPLINFSLNFLSSDGVKTTCNITGKYAFDCFSVYGKPPFTLYGAIPNTTSDSTLSIQISTQERPTSGGSLPSYSNFVQCKPGDTAIISGDHLRGNFRMSVKAGVRTSVDNSSFYINEKIKNHTSTQSIYLTKSNDGRIALMPGQEISQRHLLQNKPVIRKYSLNAASFFEGIGGEYLAGYPNSQAVRCKVYRNGVLYSTKDLSAFMDDGFGFEVDPTWTDCEIILEDIQP